MIVVQKYEDLISKVETVTCCYSSYDMEPVFFADRLLTKVLFCMQVMGVVWCTVMPRPH